MRRHRRLLAAFAGLLAVGVLSVAPASASTATLSVSPNHGHPSLTVQASGKGFASGEIVAVYFGKTLVSFSVSNRFGSFKTQFQVPAPARPGFHRVRATGRRSGRTAYARFLVRTDWTKFHFNLAGTGENPYENVLSTSNVSRLDVHWRTDFDCSIYSAPAVVAGMVFVGNYCDAIYGIDSHTGAIVWTKTTGDKATDSPAVWNGIVYAGSSDDVLYALRASTGSVVWKYRTGGAIFDQDGPAVIHGVVYVGSFDQHVYALNARTGSLLWKTALGAKIDSTPAIVDGVLYITSTDGHLYALDATSGSKLWSGQAGESQMSSPAVADGLVFIATQEGRLDAFPAGGCGAPSCPPAWGADLGGPIPMEPQHHPSAPAVAGGRVYVGSDPAETMYAFRVGGCGTTSCSPLWATKTGGNITDSPAVANGVVYAGAWDNHMYGFDAVTGAILWNKALPGDTIGFQSSPAIANGHVYVGVTFGFALYDFRLVS